MGANQQPYVAAIKREFFEIALRNLLDSGHLSQRIGLTSGRSRWTPEARAELRVMITDDNLWYAAHGGVPGLLRAPLVGRRIGHRGMNDRSATQVQGRRARTPRGSGCLFVYAGANDPRVPRSESDLIVQALRDRKVPVEYMVADNEGHSLARKENVVPFLARSARFLEDHVPARAAAAAR